MKLADKEKAVLQALAQGWTLKSHRYLDGSKEYKLHPLGDAEAILVDRETVEVLRAQALIESNKKFPAATYLLTDRGRAFTAQLAASGNELPLTASGWRADQEA